MDTQASIELNLGVDADVVSAILEVVFLASESLEDHLAVDPAAQSGTPDDPDLAEVLIHDLQATLHDDCTALIQLLQNGTLSEGSTRISVDLAESLLRSASAIRLRLRQGVLQRLEDEALETGSIRLAGLPSDQQRAYACYLFLAGLQSLVIEQLDPDAADIDEVG
jgi:hypothetical protein